MYQIIEHSSHIPIYVWSKRLAPMTRRQLEVMAAEPAFAPVVGRLCCLRGVATLTGFGLAVEIGDWRRFHR